MFLILGTAYAPDGTVQAPRSEQLGTAHAPDSEQYFFLLGTAYAPESEQYDSSRFLMTFRHLAWGGTEFPPGCEQCGVENDRLLKVFDFFRRNLSTPHGFSSLFRGTAENGFKSDGIP